jgi:REP element-mobilizing transposase RayT
MRHPTHDYSSAGAYFVTICSYERHLLFEDNSVRQVIDWAWHQIPNHFALARTDAFVVMPNHVHGIIRLNPSMVGAHHGARLPSTANRRTTRNLPAPTLGVIVRMFKSAVTRELRVQNLWDEQPFWQPNFFDRVIRDTSDLARVREYIANNPAAWAHDQENPERVPDRLYEAQWVWLENITPQA